MKRRTEMDFGAWLRPSPLAVFLLLPNSEPVALLPLSILQGFKRLGEPEHLSAPPHRVRPLGRMCCRRRATSPVRLVVQRWRRFALRLQFRRFWSRLGNLLEAAKHPELRGRQ